MPTTTTELNETMTGLWLVTTQGSEHLWDLDAKCYIRNPGPASKSRGIPGYFNGTALYWSHVEIWPKVGSCFYTIFSGCDIPWHTSSTIRSIEKIDFSSYPC